MKYIQSNAVRTFITLSIVVLFDLIVLILGYRIDSFQILKGVLSADGTLSYEVSNSNLMVVLAIFVINIFAVFHIIISATLSNQLNEIDESGHVREGLKKIEIHLMNYNKDTIAFSHLSAIEFEVGLSKEKIHNEIWILTNSFEEKNDSKEGQELRDAIIANLKTNVDYYYVVPKSSVEDIKQLGEKLRVALNDDIIIGEFLYIVDEALDFIPTPYFDIIMYFKMSEGSSEYIETSSQIYYCFSRSTDPEDCFYQKVDESEIWTKMTRRTKEYKTKMKFNSLLE